MLKYYEAAEEYMRVIYEFHKLNLKHIKTMISLPSIKHESKWTLREGSDSLLKVYRINGYMKYTFWLFYEEYAKDCDLFIQNHCKNRKFDFPKITFDMEQFKKEVADIMETLQQNFDTKPPMTGVTDDELVILIEQMFEAIDSLMSLEYKLNSIPDYSILDLQEGKRFKFFRSNLLFIRMENILLSYPRSRDVKSCKVFFFRDLNKVK